MNKTLGSTLLIALLALAGCGKGVHRHGARGWADKSGKA